jgi:hypothetical protein
VPAAGGEILFVSKAGGVLRLCADGSIYIRGTLNVQGDIRASGEITRGYGTSDTVTVGHHTHNQGVDGHGDNEVPTNAPNPGT